METLIMMFVKYLYGLCQFIYELHVTVWGISTLNGSGGTPIQIWLLKFANILMKTNVWPLIQWQV